MAWRLGCIMAQTIEDLPRSLHLEAEMMKDFEVAKKSGKYNVVEKISSEHLSTQILVFTFQ